MAEFDPVEEKAVLYVLGEMSAEESRDFEALMEESPELTERVRELEEGVVMVARACPPKRPPNEIWKNIERAIGKENTIVFGWEWFRNKGWAAAAACVVGWFVYALAVNRGPTSRTQALDNAANGSGRNGVEVANDGGKKTDAARVNVSRSGRDRDDEARREREMAAFESERLRKQVVELQAQMALISQSLTQQQELLNDPARLKFMALAPVSNGAPISATGISPQLQRALVLGMARELGWLGNSNMVQAPRQETSTSQRGATNVGGVDFVDFRPSAATNGTTSVPSVQSSTAAAPVELAARSDSPGTATTEPAASTAPGLLPAFVAADHVSVALDDSIAPEGSRVTVMAAAAGEVHQMIGEFTMSGNPTVVSFQTFNAATVGGEPMSLLFARPMESWTVILNATLPNGSSNQIQFIAAPAP
jgi:hypothetical protein